MDMAEISMLPENSVPVQDIETAIKIIKLIAVVLSEYEHTQPEIVSIQRRFRIVVTEIDTFAPSASARAFASARVIRSNVPVNTTVLPATGLSDTVIFAS